MIFDREGVLRIEGVGGGGKDRKIVGEEEWKKERRKKRVRKIEGIVEKNK